MRYGFITFRSHPLDKNLDDYWLTIIQPLLKKSEKYLLGIDKKNTLEQHFHLIISLPDSADITNLRQKFNSKQFKNFYKKIKDEQLSTYIDSKFQNGALEIKLVENTKEDHMKILGYCAKEHIHSSSEYTEVEITDAIKYHFATQRMDNSKPIEDNWKVLNTKNIYAYLEHFSKQENIKFSDPTFPLHLAKNRIGMVNISDKQMNKVISELIIANDELSDDDDKFKLNYYEGVLQESSHLYYKELHYKYQQLLAFVESRVDDIPQQFYGH